MMLRQAKVRRVALGLAALGVAGLVWLRCGPLPGGILDGVDTPSTVVVDRRGRVLYEALSSSGSRIEPFAASALPQVLVDATVAAEDRRFYSHPGVDVIALARALRQNLAERQIVEGGSTITQQVAKLLLQRRDGIRPRGFRAKVREMVLALRLEHRFDKREILAVYLNLASYGNQAAGAGRASQIYFGVDASMLTPSQAAFLAALPQRPTAFNPWKNLASAQRRQQTVLTRMAAAGTLSDERLREARAERIALRPRHTTFNAPHFVEMVSTFAAAAAGTPTSRPAGARIVTTLDLDLEREVERIVEHERPVLKAHGAANAAVVVLDNATGEWLAWEGSGNYGQADGGAINGPLVPRQPGSALKPFTYALAFEQGHGPASVLPDIATHFPTAEPGVLYSPRNYDGRYHGPMLARRALAGSQNIPAVALASDLGVSPLLRFLSRAGLSTLDRPPAYYGVGLTLGNAEVRLDELVAAYAAFARGGVWQRPTFLRDDGAAGSSSLRAGEHSRTLVSPETAFLVTDILSDPRAREQAFGRGSDLDFPFAVAVKTGTSQAYHDNWTIGYTRDVTVGVWVGNFDRTPLRNSSGVTGAGPIFHAVMLAATKGRESAGAPAILPVPDGLEQTTICTLSGMQANRWCPSRAPEWSVKGADPLPCSWHHVSGGDLLTIYPPEYRAWAAPLAPLAPAAPAPAAPLAPPAPSSPSALQIANPPAGAVYSLDPTLRREFQALSLRAVTRHPTTVTWRVNGAMIGTAPSERAVAWPLAVGTHEIEVRDPDGRLARTSVVVR
jgi:penicillin-binding protein 1C